MHERLMNQRQHSRHVHEASVDQLLLAALRQRFESVEVTSHDDALIEAAVQAHLDRAVEPQ